MAHRIKTEVIKQIGAKLHNEIPFSAFSNSCVGIICVRTEVRVFGTHMYDVDSRFQYFVGLLVQNCSRPSQHSKSHS